MEGLLKYKGRIWIGQAHNIRTKIMEAIHKSSVRGHSKIQACNKRARNLFYWPGMKKDFQEYINACEVCMKCKNENVPYPRLLNL